MADCVPFLCVYLGPPTVGDGTGGRPSTCLEAGMNYASQQHLEAIFRARAVQQYGVWDPHVPHMYGLPPPDAPVAPLANVGTPLVQLNEGAVPVAADSQIVAAQPHAWFNNAAPTPPVATPPLAHNDGAVADAIALEPVGAPPGLAETDPMKTALIPPSDITPEAAIVAYPKPIHTQSNPLNRYPSGSYDQGVVL